MHPTLRRFWLVPNLLSLDAPLVALAWQDLLAAETGIPLRLAGRLTLALTVWMIYIADRLLDVRDSARAPQTARHRFYLDNRRFALRLLAAVAVADVLVVLFDLRPAVARGGIYAAAGVLLYLAILHAPWAPRPRLIPKELGVALLFTVGTFVVAWSNSPTAAHDRLLTLAAPFFALCLANLVLIELWEWRELRGAGDRDIHWLTRTLGRIFTVWVPPLALGCLLWNTHWHQAIGLSAAATLGLYMIGDRISLEVRRALVDAVLLTPLLW